MVCHLLQTAGPPETICGESLINNGKVQCRCSIFAFQKRALRNKGLNAESKFHSKEVFLMLIYQGRMQHFGSTIFFA